MVPLCLCVCSCQNPIHSLFSSLYCIVHIRTLLACGLAASLWRAVCWSLMLTSFDVQASWPQSLSGPSKQSTLSCIRNSPHHCRCFSILNVNIFFAYVWRFYINCVWYAFRNILLRIISDECPLPWGDLCHTTVSASVHIKTRRYSHTHTMALKHTKGQTQSSVYSRHRLEHTAMCEHRYANEADRVWEVTGWGSGLTPGVRWQRQEGHDDIIQVSGELIWELSWAEPWQTRGGAWGGQGSWPYLRGHAANGV